ncbi:MAG TPA: hypothetical protein VGI87_04765 [Solirubrobacteraceae bacterium]
MRGALLLPLGILAVHQLRFQLAFGTASAARLAREGHGYLATLEPFVLLAVAIAAGAFIGRVARAWQTGDPRDGTPNVLRGRRPLLRSWVLCAAVLLAAYCVQELTEGIFAAGHPGGLAGVFGGGGWLAVPLAALIGGALAAALRIADTLIQAAARVTRATHPADPPEPDPRSEPALIKDWRLDPAAGVAAGRAPPRLSFA